jgi:hypothetical protein
VCFPFDAVILDVKKGKEELGWGMGEAAWLKFAFCFVDSVNYHLRALLWCEQVERIIYRTGVATLAVTCWIWLPCSLVPKPNYNRTSECACVLIASLASMWRWGHPLYFTTPCIKSVRSMYRISETVLFLFLKFVLYCLMMGRAYTWLSLDITSVLWRRVGMWFPTSTRLHNPEDHDLDHHRCENSKCRKVFCIPKILICCHFNFNW